MKYVIMVMLMTGVCVGQTVVDLFCHSRTNRLTVSLSLPMFCPRASIWPALQLRQVTQPYPSAC